MDCLVRLEMARDKHPHKEVEAALDHAEHHGSTPKNGSTHAKQLRQVVDGCTARQAGRDLSRNPDDDAASS